MIISPPSSSFSPLPQIIDKLSGHEGPVSSLHFNPLTAVLTSSSWDKTVRIWDIFARKPKTEVLTASADVLCVASRPDGKEICSSTLGGELMVRNGGESRRKKRNCP